MFVISIVKCATSREKWVVLETLLTNQNPMREILRDKSTNLDFIKKT